MLHKITLENFFSFRDKTEVELDPRINLLVGINGSGKSNFIKAIRLLQESIAGEGFEKIFLKDWSGFEMVANFGPNQPDYISVAYEFDRELLGKSLGNRGYAFKGNPVYEIKIHRSGSTSYYLEERLYTAVQAEAIQSKVYLDMKNGTGMIATDQAGKTGEQRYPQTEHGISFKTQEPVLRQVADPDRFLPMFTIKRAVEQMAAYDHFDTTLRSKIRQPGGFGTEERLLPSGENLAQLLNRLKNRHSLKYGKIQQLVRKINPYFIDTSFDLLGSLLYLVLREEHLGRAVGVQHISDGSLRYLLLLTVFLNPENGGLICIDEPETGLHPDMINTISDIIKDASLNEAQIVMATHSPLLLNAFDLEEILVFEKKPDNSTLVSRKSESDFEDWGGGFLAGQMWLRGEIGGKRW